MLVEVDCNSGSWAGRCERCGGPAEFARVGVQAATEPVSTPPRLRLPRVAWIAAQKWYAWRTSCEMLRWYKRVRDEEPQLTGRSLYQQVIVRRSGLDHEAARRVLRLAYERFCEWQCERTLRFRDVVQYVATDEYLRSHLAKLGTHTDMGRVVAHLIPPNL
jgi:hypothetical protein